MNDIKSALLQIGIDDKEVDDVCDFLEKCKSEDWEMSKISILAKIKDLYEKFDNGLVSKESEITDIANDISDYFTKRQIFGLSSRDIEMKETLPERRYKIKKLNTYGAATMGMAEGFHLIAAEDNVGKTGIIIQVAVDILYNNPEASVLFVTLDDTGKKLSNRFLACLGFYISGNINLTSTINFASSKYADWTKSERPDMQRNKEQAISLLREYLDSGRLVVRQGDFTPACIKRMTHSMKFKPIVVIDAIYNMNVGENLKDRSEERRQAKFPKKLSIDCGCPVLCVKEIRKSSQFGGDTEKDGTRKRLRPGVNDIGGDKMWKHEPDTIALMWSEKREIDSFGKKEVIEVTLMSLAKSKVDDLSPVIEYDYRKNKNVLLELMEA